MRIILCFEFNFFSSKKQAENQKKSKNPAENQKKSKKTLQKIKKNQKKAENPKIFNIKN